MKQTSSRTLTRIMHSKILPCVGGSSAGGRSIEVRSNLQRWEMDSCVREREGEKLLRDCELQSITDGRSIFWGWCWCHLVCEREREKRLRAFVNVRERFVSCIKFWWPPPSFISFGVDGFQIHNLGRPKPPKIQRIGPILSLNLFWIK
jgi:hypothetical protein